MTDQTIGMSVISINLSPEIFHRWATHYYKCKKDFKPPHKFSPVPYFLLCRSIELEIKSKHLDVKKQQEVKYKYGHNLMKAYNALPIKLKILNKFELQVLENANSIYTSKGFEYFRPIDALSGFKAFPDLKSLDEIAEKLLLS